MNSEVINPTYHREKQDYISISALTVDGNESQKGTITANEHSHGSEERIHSTVAA